MWSPGVWGGETASLPEIVNNFDLAGTGIGVVEENLIITGDDISHGDVLIGISSSGIHSNGLSLARKVLFQEACLKVDDPLPGFPHTTVGDELLKPTRIYVKPVMELINSDIKINGLAHITGGGFNNLKRLKKDAGFSIDYLPQPNPIFQSMHSLGVPLEEMYRVFNMGIGMVVIVPEEDSRATLNTIKRYNEAYTLGKVSFDIPGKVIIKSYDDSLIEL